MANIENIAMNVWTDHNNPSPDCAYSVRSHYFSAGVSAGRRVSDNKFSQERARVVTEAESSQMSFYLWAGRVSPAGPGVLLSCVYIMAPGLHCDNCDIRCGYSEAVSDYTFTPLCCSSVCVGGEWENERYFLNASENGMRATLWGNKTSTCARCHGAWPCCC